MTSATPVTLINSLTPVIAPVVCDFGWYWGSPFAPQRLTEYSYTTNGNPYPPSKTTLVGSVTLPTGSNIQVASTASFEPSGTLEFYSGVAPSSRTTATYTVVDATHIHCTGGTGTFNNGTAIFDPRFYVDSLPLNVSVVFDATDSNNIGINKTIAPSGISVVDYLWDLGNGDAGYGPVATTAYNYNIPPPNIQVKLTIIDSKGRTYSVGHRITLLSLSILYGASSVERQGSART